MIEHPTITRANLTGYPYREPDFPICPVCGAECETIYFDDYHEICGCDQCVKSKSAWDCPECFDE